MSCTLEDVLYCHQSSSASITIGETAIERVHYYWETVLNKKGRTVLKKISTPIPTQEVLKIKHYIRPGDECAICLEGIWTPRQAYLNHCGHSFHYACIAKWCLCSTGCPICRESVYISTAYKQIYTEVGIPRADQIEMTPEISFPWLCY